MNIFWERLKEFDAYPKPIEDFRIKTLGGGTVTIISTFLMFILFLTEISDYLTPRVTEELFVDTSRDHKLKINVNIEFPKVSCSYLSMDAMDTSGEQHRSMDHHIFKRRLDKDGNIIDESSDKPIDFIVTKVDKKEKVSKEGSSSNDTALETNKCASCYGAETALLKCCNTCDDVREAYRLKGWALRNPDSIEQCKHFSADMKKIFNEGCQIHGWLEVNRVSGSFHIAPGKSFSINHVHVHDVQPFSSSEFNMTHIIKSLTFGPNVLEGKTNPIDGLEGIAKEESTMFQYYLKVVPLAYENLTGETFTNQFSATRHQKVVSALSGDSGMPGVFFNYEISPIMIKYSQKSKSFGHFASSLFAIIGGVYTVAGLLDSTIYKSAKVLKKLEIGKLG